MAEEKFDYNSLIDKYYPEGSECRRILLKHSRQVAEKALEISLANRLDLDEESIVASAMVHDIGIFLTNAPGIDCHGKEPYISHGYLGARLLREEGAPEWLARIAERHTGAGINAEDIRRYNLPIPEGDYMPESLLEKLICYADKFYSKSGEMKEKSLDRVRLSMAKHSPETSRRFELLHEFFT